MIKHISRNTTKYTRHNSCTQYASGVFRMTRMLAVQPAVVPHHHTLTVLLVRMLLGSNNCTATS